MVELENVSFAYDKNTLVVNNISIKIKDGEAVGIIGANGCGKSTLLKLICGLLTGDGEIRVDGITVTKNNLPNVRNRVGLTFQDSDNQIFMPTVYDEIAFGLRNMGLNTEKVENRVTEVLDRLDINHLKYKHTYNLSGGEKRMVCIASVLAMHPDVVLMDEPSIALDPCNRRNVINLLRSMHETRIIASHDLDMIYETCERVIVVKNHSVVADDRTDRVLSDERLLVECGLELPLFMQRCTAYNGLGKD